MASVKHRMEYLAARAGLILVRLLSDRAADRFADMAGRAANRLIKRRRRIAEDNLRHALGRERSDTELRRVAQEVFTNAARTIVELIRFEKKSPDEIRAAVVDNGALDLMRRTMERGRGAVLVTAHFGNWELVGQYPVLCGIPGDIIVLTQSNRLVNEMVNRLRRASGAGIIEVPSETRRVFRSLKSNRMVIMAADQHSASGTLVMDFFGRPAAVFRGPALFASRCGSPIIPVLLRRERYDRHVFITGDVIEPPGSGDEEADVREMTAKYLEFVEKHIRRYPEQWLWTHNRWKLKAGDGNPRPVDS